MSNPKRVKTFLGRLESSANDKDRGLKALQVREEAHLSPYVQSKTWPGKNYIYIGHLENPLVGTEIYIQRANFISLLLEAKGNQNHCVTVEQALNFEGFVDVLSRFELSMLQRMPQYTMIGPAYADTGEPLPTAFTVWQALQEVAQESKFLVSA